MRRDVEELRGFYASPLGGAVREAVGRGLAEAWEGAAGLDVLLWGYATPFASGFSAARRVVAAMPASQGAEAWPAFARNRACLAPEDALPLPNALFDRILLAHLLEESEQPAAALAEAARVLGPSGRLVIVVAARSGLWSRAESTPFGHGRPYSRAQLEGAVREAGLEPSAWTRALYAPPHPLFAGSADLWEEAGRRLWPALSGLVLLEAVKRTFAAPARPAPARARLRVRPLLAPSPAPATRGLAARSLSGIAFDALPGSRSPAP